MAHPDLARLIAEIDALPNFHGKRLADIAGKPRALRLKWRWRFYRLADAGFVMLIWNIFAATAGSNPTWLVALAMAALNSWLIFYAESRARICTRQLNRRVAEQLARDILGLHD